RSPFVIGMMAAAGVAVTYGLVLLVVGVRDILLLVGLSMFLAVGLEPAVSWLVRHGFRRGWAVLAVFLAGLAIVGGFLASAIPVLVEQASAFVAKAPDYLRQAQDRSSWLGQLNERFHLQDTITKAFSGSSLSGGLLGAGQVVFSALTNFVIV